jgi:hypothetical protein
LLALSTRRDVFAGVWFGVSILTRPVTAVTAFISGAGEAIRRRSIVTLLSIGGTALAGVALLLVYNYQVFGIWSVRGGYSTNFMSGALDRFTIGGYVTNLSAMFFGYRGVLTSTPVVGIATYAAIRYWRDLPGWAKTGALAGLGYLLVHAILNRASGASIVFYRYPLEPLVMASAALIIGSFRLWRGGSMGKILLGVSGAIAVALQALNVFYFSCWLTFPVHSACVLS